MIDWTRTPVAVDGHRVMTYTAGTGPRTVLMVHGGPGCPSRYLRDSHQDLIGYGLRVVTWDQLGCGESDRPEDPGPQDPALWTIDRYVTEMETLFPGCSHMPFFEAPQRYLDTVAEFLQRC